MAYQGYCIAVGFDRSLVKAQAILEAANGRDRLFFIIIILGANILIIAQGDNTPEIPKASAEIATNKHMAAFDLAGCIASNGRRIIAPWRFSLSTRHSKLGESSQRTASRLGELPPSSRIAIKS
jgi:hypothetical protein